jgi:hypothetical protein
MAITIDQIQSMMNKMQKLTASMIKSMAQLNAQNSVNYSILAQCLQTVGGTYNSMSQWADLMSKFCSVLNQAAGQTVS